jgi:hypothetical protein
MKAAGCDFHPSWQPIAVFDDNAFALTEGCPVFWEQSNLNHSPESNPHHSPSNESPRFSVEIRTKADFARTVVENPWK